MSTAPPPSFDQLMEAFLERYRRGERPSPEDYARRYPELATQIREVFPGLVLMEEFGSVEGPSSASPAGQWAGDGPVPQQLAEYRILRKVGEGGMGVVYEAVQESLGRHVALKVLPPQELANPTRLERFRREAKAAARLHHTNIVPVFGVGEQDGISYYAMQFIQGQGLDKVLHELKRLRSGEVPAAATAQVSPSQLANSIAHGLLTGCFQVGEPAAGPGGEAPPAPATGGARDATSSVRGSGSHSDLITQGKARYFRSVAEVGVQVAEALAYAHGQGVVHRDIKPANLMLDTQGTVWVTDFGLAKMEGSDDLTSPGDVVGTLRYMAPERFRGRSEPGSDIYGLGMTLYELLLLRPAFEDADRVRLIDRVQREEPARPRKLDRDIPRDLETVVLKAMAKEPGDRYASAADLAEDLRRFLGDRPIRARRVRLPERAWRWCRRNKAVASMGSFIAALVMMLAIGATIAALKFSHQADDLRVERDEGQKKLFDSLKAQARASRFSRQIGQRFETLATIEKAVTLARKLDLSPEELDKELDELRTIAIAALALPDLRPALEWISDPDGEGWGRWDFDGHFRFCAVTAARGDVSIRPVNADREKTTELLRVPGLGGWPYWSPDGEFLAVESFSRLRVGKVEVTDGKAQWRQVLEQTAAIQAFDFSPDSKRLLRVQPEGTLHVYDLTTGRPLHSWTVPAGSVRVVHHPCQPQAVLSCPGFLLILDLTTGQEVARLPFTESVWWVAWHPAGELLAVADERHIHFWDVPRRQRTWSMEHRGGGMILAFSPSGDLLASSGWSGQLKLWDPYTGRQVFEIRPGWCYPRFGPGNRLGVAFPGDPPGNPFRLTQVELSREYRSLRAGALRGGSKDYRACDVHPNGRLLAVGTGEGLSLIDLATGSEREFLRLGTTTCVLFEPSGALLANSSGHGVLRWPVREEAGDPGRLRVGPPEIVPVPARGNWIARSRDGTMLALSAGDNGGAYVWHRDRAQEGRLLKHGDCRSVGVSPDGRLAATGSHGGTGLRVWDTATGELRREFMPATSGIYSCFSGDGRWLATIRGKYWRVSDWSEGPAIPEGEVTLARDGGLLAVGKKNGTTVLINPDTGRTLARLDDPHQDQPYFLTFGPDSTQLFVVSSEGMCVHVWDLRRIREQLAKLGLDWEGKPYPPAAERAVSMPLAVKADLGELAPPP